jgi:hypothetical protein
MQVSKDERSMAKLKALVKKILCTLVVVVTLSTSVLALMEENNYILYKGERIPIPLSYVPTKTVVSFGKNVGSLQNPTDLFIDKNQNLYVLDSGNGRVLKLTLDGNFIKEYKSPDNLSFKGAEGIFVDESGYVYVADTQNGRIVILDEAGAQKGIITEPKSKYYDSFYDFRPSKLYKDSIGQIYIINKEDYHGFIVLKSDYTFRGYIAPTKVAFSWITKLTNIFATQDQKERLNRTLPPVHTNFIMDSEGMLYTTTIRTQKEQIKRFTNTGRNILPNKGFFGELESDYLMSFIGKAFTEPQFVDIAINKDSYFTAADSGSGRIYQYDIDGEVIAVFGGSGISLGKFSNIVSLVESDNGNIFVLDGSSETIQTFEPTDYIRNVHSALSLYYDGDYNAALEPVKKIFKADKNNVVGNIISSKVYLKEGKYLESMKDYKIADNMAGYSQAFSAYRHKLFRKYFGLWILCAVAVCILLFMIIKVLRKGYRIAFENGIMQKKHVNGLYMFCAVLYKPMDAFEIMKWQRGYTRRKWILFLVILFLVVASRICRIYGTQYLMAGVLPDETNIMMELVSMLFPILSIGVCMYLVTTIRRGETTFSEQMLASAYCMLPYIVMTLPVTLLSHLMTLENTGMFNMLNGITWIWVGLLAITSLGVMNSYTFKQTLWNAILSVFSVLFIWSLIGIIYILGLQFTQFISQVSLEYTNYLFH